MSPPVALPPTPRGKNSAQVYDSVTTQTNCTLDPLVANPYSRQAPGRQELPVSLVLNSSNNVSITFNMGAPPAPTAGLNTDFAVDKAQRPGSITKQPGPQQTLPLAAVSTANPTPPHGSPISPSKPAVALIGKFPQSSLEVPPSGTKRKLGMRKAQGRKLRN